VKPGQRDLFGYWPSFALVAVALALTMTGHPYPSLLLSGLSLAYLFRRGRKTSRARKEANRATERRLPDPPRWMVAQRRHFEPFGICPGCKLATFHLFGPSREVAEVEQPARWATGIGAVWALDDRIWNSEGVYRTQKTAKPEATEAQPTITVVVDRECLTCGKTWEETP
jgi:hypothetical protein